MFGSFTESALLEYAEKAAEAYREKRVGKKQGTEYADTNGIGEGDHSFIDTDESQDSDDYSETYDFTTCIRPDGSLYGIRGGKCRKGKEIDRASVDALKASRKPSAKERQAAAIQKRGERSLKRATAEKVLDDLRKEGASAKKATERRAQQGKGHDREEQVRQLRARAFLTMERLQAKAKRMVPGDRKDRVLARIARLQSAMKRLDQEQSRIRKAASKRPSEAFGRIPSIYETGRGLA